jgi:tetratricopeptide (TPR) repeat protein
MVPIFIRYFSFTAILCFSLLLSWGCHKKPAIPVPAPTKVAPAPPVETAPPAIIPPLTELPKEAPLEPAPLPKIVTAPSSYDLGESNFHAGRYRQAAKSFEDFLGTNPQSNDRDQALFHLGLSRALATDSSRDLRQADAAFRRLIKEFPNSPYKNQAELILGLQTQIDRLRTDVRERDEKIKKLSEELQKLKEIDMQRRPSRPRE